MDIQVQDEGSIVVLRAQNTAARMWLEQNCETERWNWWGAMVLCVEHRYADDIIQGAIDAGLTIGVD